jgi:hypothetical protein
MDLLYVIQAVHQIKIFKIQLEFMIDDYNNIWLISSNNIEWIDVNFINLY